MVTMNNIHVESMYRVPGCNMIFKGQDFNIDQLLYEEHIYCFTSFRFIKEIHQSQHTWTCLDLSTNRMQARRGSRICGRGGGAHRERRRREALLGGSASSLIRGKGGAPPLGSAPAGCLYLCGAAIRALLANQSQGK